MTVLAPANAPVNPSTTSHLLAQLEAELNLRFFERRDAINAVLICLLARQHGFVLGPPGTAKSELLEMVCRSIVGAKYWRILLDRQMGKEESFGQIDQPLFLQTGEWRRDTVDTLADAHVALLDEVGNTGPSVLNAYLTAMNERMFKAGKTWDDIPLLSAFGASNFVLEDGMEAMWDRFPVRFEVGDIVEDGNFLALLEMAAGQRPQAQVTTTIPLPQLLNAIHVEVPAIFIPAHVFDAVRQLRSDLAAEQVHASPRRWAQSTRLLKASAFLAGRSEVDEDDLSIFRHVLWDVPEQRAMVERKVVGFTSSTALVAVELAEKVNEIMIEVGNRVGRSLEDRALYGADAMHTLSELSKELDSALATATSEGRATARLDAVRERISEAFTEVYVVCMNTPRERAVGMGRR